MDDTGVEMPDDLFVDLAIDWPVEEEGSLFLSGLTGSPTIITLSVSVKRPNGTVELLASGSADPRATDSVTLNAVGTNGTTGRAIFGYRAQRLTETQTYRFSTPEQSLIAMRCIRFYRQTGIQALQKQDISGSVVGLTEITAGSDLKVEIGERVVQGRTVTGLIIGLADRTTTTDLYERYAGQCGGRPESDTCTMPPVQFLQNVIPDCAGNVNLVFDPPIYSETSAGHISVWLDLQLDQVCVNRLPDADGNLPGFPFDDFNTGEDPDPYPGEPATPTGPDPIDISSTVIDCSTLPYCGIVGTGFWQVLTGSWVETPASFPHCPDEASLSSSIGSGSVSLDPHLVCETTDQRCLQLWYDCAYDDSLNLEVETVVKVGVNGAAGIVMGYEYDTATEVDTYLALQIDRQTSRLSLRRWTGFGYVTLLNGGPLPFSSDVWYRVRLSVSGGMTGPVTITIAVGAADEADALTAVTTSNTFPRTGGRVGVISERASNGFGYFGVR